MTTDDDRALFERIAVFRHTLVARLLVPEHTRAERLAERMRILTSDHLIPGSTRTRVADATVRDWVRAYRAGGFEALKPKKRIDAGGTRALDPKLADVLISIKEAEPGLAIRAVIARVRTEGVIDADAALAPSTVHRLFQRHGLGGRARHRDDGGVVADRRRFAFERPCQLWMSDVMHGPAVRIDAGQRRRSYLICLLDDATRVVVHAQFASLREPARLLARAAPGGAAAWPTRAVVRRQRRRLPCPPARGGVRPARHRADPRPALPAPGQGQDRALLPHRACAAAAAAAGRGPAEHRGAEPATRRLDRGRVPPQPPPRARWRHAAGSLGGGGGRDPPPRGR